MRTLEQVTSVSESDRALLTRLKEIVRRFVPTATCLLYGSVARGDQQADSDYDVLILTDDELPRKLEDALEREIYLLQLTQGVILETMYFTRARWREPVVSGSPFHEEVERDAVLL